MHTSAVRGLRASVHAAHLGVGVIWIVRASSYPPMTGPAPRRGPHAARKPTSAPAGGTRFYDHQPLLRPRTSRAAGALGGGADGGVTVGSCFVFFERLEVCASRGPKITSWRVAIEFMFEDDRGGTAWSLWRRRRRARCIQCTPDSPMFGTSGNKACAHSDWWGTSGGRRYG